MDSKVETAEIQTCNDNEDEKLQVADIEIENWIRKWLRDREKDAEINAKNEKLQFEEELQKMKLQLKTEQ